MKRFSMVRSSPIKNTGREFDVEFWQRLGTEAILDAAWEMVLTAHHWKGRRSELRLQRVITSFSRLQGPVSHRRRIRRDEVH